MIARPSFGAATAIIMQVGKELAKQGWTPATSSNFSVRIDSGHIAITRSGRDKGNLGADDVMLVDPRGNALEADNVPSAETLLHVQLYRMYPDTGAVLHTHSVAQTVASRLFAKAGQIVIRDYELLKAFSGFTTHECAIALPVFPNSQDMPQLVERIEAHARQAPFPYGYLIEGHGIYAWGRDVAEAKRHLEAFEFLLNCELALRRLEA